MLSPFGFVAPLMFNPMCAERPTRGRSRDKSTIVVKYNRGITTIAVYSAEKPHDHIVELHSFETQTEDLATHGLKELFENISDENIIDEDPMAHVDDSFQEEIPKEFKSFINKMLDNDRHQGVHPYDAMFDFENLEKTIPDVVEEMLHVDGHETIYAIGDRKLSALPDGRH